MADEGALKQVTAGEAVELANAGTLLVDVREQWEWDRGHAPNALHLPMGALGDRVDELPHDADMLIICHSGARSLTVVTALADAGYRAINVLGGMTAWERSGGSVMGTAPQSPSA